MPDKYRNFNELSQNETSGIDFSISVRRAKDAFAIVAPHGGGIEPGTSEIADSIAAEEFSYYAFDGLKRSGNTDLHITSTRFDEPMCLIVIRHSDVVLTIHGEGSDGDGSPVFLGGLDDELGPRVGAALETKGFDVRRHPDPQLQGRERKNICNRGRSGKGVQLELSLALRKEFFRSLSREGRKETTPRFLDFVNALRGALNDEGYPCRAFGQGQG
ncbi:MAG: poly-gamma-glutamate hydrolase family protein [Bryobacteraceae bacterium]